MGTFISPKFLVFLTILINMILKQIIYQILSLQIFLIKPIKQNDNIMEKLSNEINI